MFGRGSRPTEDQAKQPEIFSRDHGVSPPASSDSSLGQHYSHEKGANGELFYDDDIRVPTLDKKDEIKLIAQIDWRVLPVLCAMFTLAFLDKVNIANAETFGLSEELELKGTEYNNSFYVISMWYRRQEALKRFTFFYNSISLAGAFGGLAAYGIGHMAGDSGYAGWRWIFIVEGSVTAVLGFIFFFLIPDFPEDSKWTTPEQRAWIKARLAADEGPSARDRPMQLKDVTEMFSDWKVWIAGLLYLGCATPGYAYAFFSPTIIKHFGYSALKTQLYGVAPWAGAWVAGMTTAFISDWVQHRFLFVVVGMLVSIAGCATLLGTTYHDVHTQYGMLFLFIGGIYISLPIVVCWFNMNLAGHHRRAIGGAWQIGIGQAGGIIAVYTFLKKDAPEYVPGYSAALAFDAFTIVMGAIYFYGLWAENKRRDRIMRSQHGEGVVGMADGSNEVEKAGLGDRALTYRYML
ncbi:MAG: hypothetical protein Q9162_000689 [Coniocarpon cinnabarinum]